MKKVIFSKFSRERKIEYQIVTKLIDDGGCKKIVKENLDEAGRSHVGKLVSSMEVLRGYYQDEGLVVTPCELVDGAVCFEFIDGCRLDEYLSKIYVNHGYLDLKKEIIKLADMMKHVKETKPFEITKEFEDVFGGYDYSILKGKRAYVISNIDMIFGNLILRNEKLYITDYEWVFDFNVPINYVIYRSLLLSGLFTSLKKELQDDMLDALNICADEIACYMNMETSFQNYVSGKKVLEEYSKNNFNTIFNINIAEKAIDKKTLACYKYNDGDVKTLCWNRVFVGDFIKVEFDNNDNAGKIEFSLDCRAAIIRISNVYAIDNNGAKKDMHIDTNADFNVVEDYYFSSDGQSFVVDGKDCKKLVFELKIYCCNMSFIVDYIGKIKLENQLRIQVAEEERKNLLKDGDIRYRDEVIKSKDDMIEMLQNEITAMKSTKVWRAYEKLKGVTKKSE